MAIKRGLLHVADMGLTLFQRYQFGTPGAILHHTH
jgi:hypothetical protein